MTDVSKLDLVATKARLHAPYSRKLKMALRTLHAPFRENYDRAARSGKKVGRKTQVNRRDRVELCIRQIHALGYEIESGSKIRHKHLRALMRYWLANDLKASTIQNLLSALRTYLAWIGKGGMLGSGEEYLPEGVNPDRIRVPSVAQKPKGWAENNVDLAGKIRELVKVDDRVAMVMLVEAEFGLRRLEAAVFRPGVHLDRYGGSIPLGATIEVREGTKGGRARTVPITSQRQIDVINMALTFCQKRGDSLVPPGMNARQFVTRIANVVYKLGFTKANHCNLHSLRHTYAVTLYEEITGYQAPVRGQGRMTPVDGCHTQVAEVLASAERAVAENLGHSRPQVSRAYLGGVSTSRTREGEEQEHGTPNAAVPVDEDESTDQ